MIWKMPIRLSILENDDLDKDDLENIKKSIETFSLNCCKNKSISQDGYRFDIPSIDANIEEDFDNNEAHYLNVTAAIDSSPGFREHMITTGFSLFFIGKMVLDKNTKHILQLKELKLMYSNGQPNPTVLIE